MREMALMSEVGRTIEEIIREQLELVVDAEELEKVMERAKALGESGSGLSGSGSWPGLETSNLSFDSMLDASLGGESLFDTGEIIESLKDLFLLEIKNALVLGAEILLVCIIIGLISNLGTSFKRKEIAGISTLVCVMVIIGISVNSFRISYRLCIGTVDAMVYTMEIITPVMMGILAATGRVAAGTVMNPLLMGAVTGFGAMVKNVIMPTLFASAVLSVVNSMTEKSYVGKMAKLLRSAAAVAVGLVVVLLSGIIAVQGLISETSDGILMSTAKYSLSTFVPIVGNFTSDTAELFVFCMSSIKRLVGVFGVVTLVVMIGVPLVKILTVALVYKLTAAVAEPISEGQVSEGISEMGSVMSTMCAIVFFCALLFVIFLSIVAGMGGVPGGG